MNSEDLQISNSCETYILSRVPFLMSSFPGYIVFGKSLQGRIYISNKCLKFSYFDYEKLFGCVIGLLSFVAEEEKTITELTHFFKKDQESYFWQGFSKKIENKEEKFIRFVVESEFEKNELTFSLVEFNNFIFVLKRCLIASLCLKDEEEVFVSKLINKDLDFIIRCKDSFLISHDFVSEFLKNDASLFNKKASLIELVRYHNESICILKKLNDIFVQEDDSEINLNRFVSS